MRDVLNMVQQEMPTSKLTSPYKLRILENTNLNFNSMKL